MNAHQNLDTRPCYKCKERHLLCHSECERYAAYRADLDAHNAEVKRKSAGVIKKEMEARLREMGKSEMIAFCNRLKRL